MAKVTGPLLSFGAKGKIGDAAVFASWKGIDYARSYVKPSNPRTQAQQKNRTRFALLREMWKRAPAPIIDAWNTFALGRPFTGMNKYVGENNRVLKLYDDLTELMVSPGAGGGLPASSVTAEAGASAGLVDVTVAAPATLPDGWTVTRVVAALVHDQDPSGIFAGPFTADTDAGPQATITLDAEEAAKDCIALGFIEYEKPTGAKAYSASIAVPVTSAA